MSTKFEGFIWTILNEVKCNYSAIADSRLKLACTGFNAFFAHTAHILPYGCSASTWGGLRTFWSLRLFQLLCWKLTKPHLIECKACNSWRVCAIVHFCGVKDKWIAASGVEQPMQSLFCGAPQPHHNYTITTTTTTTQPDFALPSLLLHPSTIIVHTKWS